MAKKAARLVNTSDLAEFHRGEFQRRCHEANIEEVQREMRWEQARSSAVLTTTVITATTLESMFSTLDPSLVRSISAEAATPQQALQILLALSASIAAPAAVEEPPSADIGVDDHEAFPVLLDTDGWQVVSNRAFINHDSGEKTCSAWCDRAKAAAELPQQKIARSTTGASASARQCRAQQQFSARSPPTEEGLDHPSLTVAAPAEYLQRQEVGQRHVERRAGRGWKKGGLDIWKQDGKSVYDLDESKARCSSVFEE